MGKNKTVSLAFDKQGHLILPEEIKQKYGLIPGAVSRIELSGSGLELSRSSMSLAKVTIEPTNACNLDCSTCMRNVWEEPLGKMTKQTFEQIIQGIQTLTPIPTVFFGGFGEPLSQPHIKDMVESARKIGAEVDLITNGILLDEKTAGWMIDLGVSQIWVSIDGATPESYADVRLGDELPKVIQNLTSLKTMKLRGRHYLPKLGIAFVAMKRNIADLPAVVALGKSFGAEKFSISNVLPHTLELRDQVLYAKSMYNLGVQPSDMIDEVNLPRMDLDDENVRIILDVLKRNRNKFQISRQPIRLGENSCPFIEQGSISIRWDGAVSPCLPLMYTHTSYLDTTQKTSHAYSVGNINDQPLADLWKNEDYVRLRERLIAFDFSPCTICNSCWMAEDNLEDCLGNTHPTCGSCLWAQGFVQCP